MRNHVNKISDFGQRLLVLLEANNLTQTQFSILLDLSTGYTGNLIHGRAKGTGGKFWDAIRKHFPDWEEFLRDHVKSPPGSTIVGGDTQGQKISVLREAAQGRGSHEDLIQHFKDKAWAIELNRMLLELERVAPDKKEIIFAYVQGMLSMTKAEKKKKNLR